MLRNYLTIAWRNLLRNRTFTAINVFGLSVAIGVCLLLFLTAFRELSYDNFHEQGDRLYRVFSETEHPERGLQVGTSTSAPLLPTALEQLPGALGTRWVTNSGTAEVKGVYHKLQLRYADTAFFRMFSFPLEQGQAGTVLSDINSVVLSRKTALRLFDTDDVVGRTLPIHSDGGPKTFTISGIAEDYPDNSSLDYDAIVLINNNPNYAPNLDQWSNMWHATFLLLPENIEPAEAERRLQAIANQYFAEDIENLRLAGAKPGPDGQVFRYRLQPVRDLHYGASMPAGDQDNGRLFSIALMVVGIFILVIACINFVNLTLGTSLRRSVEISVRKVVGASRRQVAYQFWAEALLVIMLALVAGLLLARAALPQYNALFNKPIELWQPGLWLAISCIVTLAALLGGGYPALVLSRFQLASVLKRDTPLQKQGLLRKVLIVVQFTIAIVLVCSTLIVRQQLEYFRSRPLGYNQEQVVSIPVGNTMTGERAVNLFRQRAGQNADIHGISASFGNFGLGKDGSTVTSIFGFQHENRPLTTHYQRVDYDFLETMDIELLAGRDFQRNRATDTVDAIIINETFAKLLGPNTQVGDRIELDSPAVEIIGIVEDFNFRDLSNPVEPLTLGMNSDFPLFYILVKVSPENTPRTMAFLEDVWGEIAPGADFQASFLNENTERLYKGEQTMSKIFLAAALLTILLSCMGLFAMAVLSVTQRTKEIGIRRVLGASPLGIMGLLARPFTLLVALSALVAIPLAWYGMRLWLDNYAYRTDLQWWVFALAGLIAVALAIVTVSLQSIRAALANPVKSLRTE